MIIVKLRECPKDSDWKEVYVRALVTVGKKPNKEPTKTWKKKILKARHSPIRRLHFSFELVNIPYYVSVHLARHIHAQPYIMSQRNDRQDKYDRNEAPQNAPVNMIWDMNAEEMLTIFNKRLCNLCDPTTKRVVELMRECVIQHDDIYTDLAVPNCQYLGRCNEMFPCKKGESHE